MTEIKSVKYVQFADDYVHEVNTYLSQGYEMMTVINRVLNICATTGDALSQEYVCLVLYSSK